MKTKYYFIIVVISLFILLTSIQIYKKNTSIKVDKTNNERLFLNIQENE